MTNPVPTALQEDFTLLLPTPTAPAADGSSLWLVATVLGLVLALALLLVWLARRRRQVTVVAETADEIALRELDNWERLADGGEVREAMTGISGTVRRYVDARFGLAAPLLTTEEFWQVQDSRKLLPRDKERFWQEFLWLFDLVKYAGSTPSDAQLTRALEAGRKFVGPNGSEAGPVKGGGR